MLHHGPLIVPPSAPSSDPRQQIRASLRSEWLEVNGMRFDPSPSRVAGKLYQGAFGWPATQIAAGSGVYQLLVHCAHDVLPIQDRPDGTDLLYVPFKDDVTSPPTAETVEKVMFAARHVQQARKLGKRVLVGCAMGLNRSGFVVAMALRMGGCTPAQAIERVRAARGPDALSNRRFVKAIEDLKL
jgi:hypothetical protein